MLDFMAHNCIYSDLFHSVILVSWEKITVRCNTFLCLISIQLRFTRKYITRIRGGLRLSSFNLALVKYSICKSA